MKENGYVAYKLKMQFFNLSEEEQKVADKMRRAFTSGIVLGDQYDDLLRSLGLFVSRHIYAKAKEVAGTRTFAMQLLQDIVVYSASLPKWSDGREQGDFMQANVTLLVPKNAVEWPNFMTVFEEFLVAIAMEKGDKPEDYAVCYNGVEVGKPKFFIRLREEKDHQLFKSMVSVHVMTDKGIGLDTGTQFNITQRYRELTGTSHLFSIAQVSYVGIFAISTTLSAFDEGSQIAALRDAIYDVFDLNVDCDVVKFNWFTAV